MKLLKYLGILILTLLIVLRAFAYGWIQTNDVKKANTCMARAGYEIITVHDKLYVMVETLRTVKALIFADYKLTNEALKSEYTITLVQKKGITEITTEYRITGNNLMWKSTLFLSKSYLEAESQNQMDLLKLEIETSCVEFHC